MTPNILTDRQIGFLNLAKNEPFIAGNFVLTGGTALAAYHLGHRYSEDLDFFSEKEFEILPLDIFFRKAKQKLTAEKVDFQQSYNRNLFFLHFSDGEILKTEFTYFPFPKIKIGPKDGDLFVESKLDIAVNKLFTIYQRSVARDYIDLYLLCKQEKYEMAKLLKKARVKFDWHIDPLQLGTQFLKAETAEDFPRMITELQPQKWRNFFREEAKKLKSVVLE